MRTFTGIFVLLALTLPGCSGGNTADLSKANYDKINTGMTLQEVEKILSAKGTRADKIELTKENEKKRAMLMQFREGTTRYAWQKGKTLLYVDLDDRSGKVVGKGSRSGS